MFKNKKIAIWGKGKEGEALLKYCLNNDIQHVVLEGEKINFKDVDVIFKSPGVSLYNSCLQNALKTGLEVWTGTNIFMAGHSEKMKTIAVTGTKGKSTTSSLIAHILQKKGYKVGFGGNIGRPLIEFVEQDFDFLVAELSSYQCADLKYPFDISVVTNLYPEHIDWHKTHDCYYEDKLNLIRIRKDGQKAILNASNPETLKRCQNEQGVLYFNTAEGMHLEDGFIVDGDKKLFETSKIKNLKGEHNLENICAVLTVLKDLNIDLDGIEDDITSFNALPHRLQVVATVNGTTFVDDSISTTPETSVAALKAFHDAKHIYLLVGGYNRNQDYTVLLDYVRQNSDKITLLTLPVTGDAVAEQAVGLDVFKATDVSNAVFRAQKLASAGDVVLLSPGAPSYHAYKNFEARGEDFVQSIRK